jgi:hypothetical protein
MRMDAPPAYTELPQDVPQDARPHTFVVVGNTGSGKSSSARWGIVEPILRAHRRAAIIDPTGVWWGLRFMRDGSPGFRIPILGGLYGDAPLHDYDAAAVARWIGENDVPVILDLSEMTIGERHDFGADFFAALYQANRRPLHLVIDEADEFAPQNPMPETKRLLHHVDRIVRRGRVRGFRPVMITQRPSVLHKNVMSQASALVAMRLLGSQDRAAVELWIKGQGDLAAGKEVLNTLARLQVGEGWLWVPGLNILNRGRFQLFETYDSSRTPKDDEPPVEPPGPFPWADEFRELLEHVVAADPPADPDAPPATADELAAAEKRGRDAGRLLGFDQGFHAATAALQGRVTGVLKSAEEFMAGLRETAASLANGGANPPAPPATLVVHPTRQAAEEWAKKNAIVPKPAAPAPKPAPPVARAQLVTASNSGGEKMLKALAMLQEQRPWEDVCVLAGILHANGNFWVGRKYLLGQGYATEGAGQVLATPAGIKIAGGRQPALSRAEIIQLWQHKLRSPGGLMLQAIAGARGCQMSKQQLVAALGIKPDNGNWWGGLKALRKANLMEQEGDTYRLTSIVREAR